MVERLMTVSRKKKTKKEGIRWVEKDGEETVRERGTEMWPK